MRKIISILVVLTLVTSFIVVFPIENVEAADAYAEFNPTDDALVSEESPDYNHGDGSCLRFRTKSGIQRYNFIKFNVSTIQPGTTIKSATLMFYWYSQHDGSAFGYTASAYRITEDWDEYNVTWNNQPNHSLIATNTTTMPSSLDTWVSWDVTSDVQDFVDGTVDNYGWRTEGNNFSGNTITDFYSKEYRDYFPNETSGLEPCLEIEIADVYVDDDAPPEWYDATHVKTIQEGINNASSDDTVFVYNGTYYENVVIDKTVNLFGEDRNITIIESVAYADVVYLSLIADWVNISGFTLRYGWSNTNGIGVRSNYNTITNNNIISNNYLGIYLYSSNGNTISNNNISNNSIGIRIEDSFDNTVIGNTINSNNMDGIWLYFSSNNVILNNSISSNDDDAVVLYSSNNNTILDNIISFNDDNGIIIYYPSNNNIISGNNILSNNDDGVYINASNNYIYHNNFIDNLQNAYDEGDNTWDDGYPSGGNFWSDYTGDDDYHGSNQNITRHDRIGDIPYEIPCEHGTDFYPVMHPYGWLNEAPENIIINGPTSGKVGQVYTYTTSAEDPEVDPIYYIFDWGDGTNSSWLGPYNSGDVASASHIWWKKGTYNIKVKAKDTRDKKSEWSDPLIITMPRDKSINNLFFRFLENNPFLYQLLQLLLQRFGL